MNDGNMASSVMALNPTRVKPDDRITTAANYIMKHRYRNLPVIDDAEAVCEAMSRPSMRFVAVKSVEEQQDIQAV